MKNFFYFHIYSYFLLVLNHDFIMCIDFTITQLQTQQLTTS